MARQALSEYRTRFRQRNHRHHFPVAARALLLAAAAVQYTDKTGIRTRLDNLVESVQFLTVPSDSAPWPGHDDYVLTDQDHTIAALNRMHPEYLRVFDLLNTRPWM